MRAPSQPAPGVAATRGRCRPASAGQPVSGSPLPAAPAKPASSIRRQTRTKQHLSFACRRRMSDTRFQALRDRSRTGRRASFFGLVRIPNRGWSPANQNRHLAVPFSGKGATRKGAGAPSRYAYLQRSSDGFGHFQGGPACVRRSRERLGTGMRPNSTHQVRQENHDESNFHNILQSLGTRPPDYSIDMRRRLQIMAVPASTLIPRISSPLPTT